ncbi:MAG: DUF1080 domain-containing protein [Phycisphaerae bacterium]
MRCLTRAAASLLLLSAAGTVPAGPPEGEDWRPLFNGKDLSGWVVPRQNNGAWKAVDGVIDYDAKAGKHLWTEESFSDFDLHVEWRLKAYEEVYGDRKGSEGEPIPYTPDSGILLRGNPNERRQVQVNIKATSSATRGPGEIHPQCSDRDLPEAVRKTYQPKQQAARPLGQWNAMRIRFVGDRIGVVLNGITVVDGARLPEAPRKGPIALQHHGGWKRERNAYHPLSSLVQFRNIYIRRIEPKGARKSPAG